MAVSIIIYFGLGAGFSLLKLHPLELGSCLNSCNRNELRFPGKGNANLPLKCFFTRVYQLQPPWNSQSGQGQGSFPDEKSGMHCLTSGTGCVPHLSQALRKGFKMLWKVKELSCSPITGTRVPFPAVTSCFCGTKPGAPSVFGGDSSCPALGQAVSPTRCAPNPNCPPTGDIVLL